MTIDLTGWEPVAEPGTVVKIPRIYHQKVDAKPLCLSTKVRHEAVEISKVSRVVGLWFRVMKMTLIPAVYVCGVNNVYVAPRELAEQCCAGGWLCRVPGAPRSQSLLMIQAWAGLIRNLSCCCRKPDPNEPKGPVFQHSVVHSERYGARLKVKGSKPANKGEKLSPFEALGSAREERPNTFSVAIV